jgi:hypothetical protein
VLIAVNAEIAQNAMISWPNRVVSDADIVAVFLGTMVRVLFIAKSLPQSGLILRSN